MTYCIDTSALLDGWVRWYPIDVFPTFWSNMEVAIANGALVISDELYGETKKKDDGLSDWIKTRKELLVPTDGTIVAAARAVLGKYPRMVDTAKGRSQADPFVVAVAQVGKHVVVPGESPGNASKPRIPFVCQQLGIQSMGTLQFIRDMKWNF